MRTRFDRGGRGRGPGAVGRGLLGSAGHPSRLVPRSYASSPVTLIAEDLLLLLLTTSRASRRPASWTSRWAAPCWSTSPSRGWSRWRARVAPGFGEAATSTRCDRRETGSWRGRWAPWPRTSSAQRLVVKVGKGLLDPLAERQRQRGVLDRREEKVLGLVTRTRWPSRDPSRKEAIRRGLVVILVQGGRARRPECRAHRAAPGREPPPPDRLASRCQCSQREEASQGGRRGELGEPERSRTPSPWRRPPPLPRIRRPSTESDRRPARRRLRP